ncbi:MAG: methyltransferase [Alphaproteobacteria bacterium]|nr:methyltransferase [Alphaproteobacteria bacterium]
MEETKGLAEILKKRIAEAGPISVAEYMEAALSHPEFGYYRKQRVFGAAGDFTTSPEISQVFGELIGAWVIEQWQHLGEGPVSLVELGPGRGTLMHDLLRVSRGVSGFHDALTVHMVESSPELAHEQYQRLRMLHPRIEWLDHLEQLPEGKPLIVIANEFFDALPIKQHVKTADGICERRVGYDEDTQQFIFTLGPAGLQLAKSSTIIPDGTVIESSPASKEYMRLLASRLKADRGAALIIDYGYLGDAHHDTLQAVKAHQFHPVLKSPGEADITAHVDFATLMKVAASSGVSVHGLVTQGRFLAAMGVDIRLESLLKRATPEQKEPLISGVTRLVSPHAMGELFKVMALTYGIETPSGF